MEKTFESLCLKGGYLILVLQSHHTAAGEFNKQCNLLPSDVSTLAHIRQIQSVITLYKKNPI